MSTKRATRHERLQQYIGRHFGAAIDAGIIHLRAEDDPISGAIVTIAGRPLVNMTTCSYLAVNLDARVRKSAIAAIERFGPSYSSSISFIAVDLYTELEGRLQRMVDAPVAIPASTTLGHLSALPVLIGPEDLVVADLQVHASVQLTMQVLKANGTEVEVAEHNDMAALERRVVEADDTDQRVWYLADGVYSMYGDIAPLEEIARLLATHPNLYVYLDDAHGFSWTGRHGRGVVLDRLPIRDRMVVAVSLSKSFGGAGGALVFPNEELARRVRMSGSTFMFSGPVPPAELGAGIASADIHLSDEHPIRSAELHRQISLVRELLVEHRLPAMALEQTPIWFVRVGSPESVIELTRRLMEDGFYVNPAVFPVVPVGYGGVRFTHTLHHSDAQLEAFADALARHIPDLVEDIEVIVDLR